MEPVRPAMELMATDRPLISVCIPAYNRARFLPELLDSILTQDFRDHEILIAEDNSPERAQLRSIVESYRVRHPGVRLRFLENPVNLGYDGNVRNLIAEALGRFCFFMGNDDVMYPGALAAVSRTLAEFPAAGFVLKGYSWFEGALENVAGTVRYSATRMLLEPGEKAVSFCFRRCGVISGLIVDRDLAHGFATAEFDGTLYYQMYAVGRVLAVRPAVVVPDILVACRAEIPPDFGNSEREKSDFVPGRYTPHARLTMLRGLLRIARAIESGTSLPVYDAIVRDISAHFFPYMRDQVDLPMTQYWRYYRENLRLGFGRTPYFHAYFVLGRLLGARRFDRLTQKIRNALGRTVVLG